MQNLLFCRPSLAAILAPKLHGATAKTTWLTLTNSEMINAAFHAESRQTIRKFSVLKVTARFGTLTPLLSSYSMQKRDRPSAHVSSHFCNWWLAFSRPPDTIIKWQTFSNPCSKIADICVERCRTLPTLLASVALPRTGVLAHFVGLNQLHMFRSPSAPVLLLSYFCSLRVPSPPASNTVKFFPTLSVQKISNTGGEPCRLLVNFCARPLRASTGTLHICFGSKQSYPVHILSAPTSRISSSGWLTMQPCAALFSRPPDHEIAQTLSTASLHTNPDYSAEPCRTSVKLSARHSAILGPLAHPFGSTNPYPLPFTSFRVWRLTVYRPPAHCSMRLITVDLPVAEIGAELCRANRPSNVQNICVHMFPLWPAGAALSPTTRWVHVPFPPVAPHQSGGGPFTLPPVAVLCAPPPLAVVRAPRTPQPMWIIWGVAAHTPLSRLHVTEVLDVPGRLRHCGNCIRPCSYRPVVLPSCLFPWIRAHPSPYLPCACAHTRAPGHRLVLLCVRARARMRLVPSHLWTRTHPSPYLTCAHTCAPRHRLVLLCVRARARTRELTAFRDPNTNPIYRRLRSNPNYRRLRSNPNPTYRRLRSILSNRWCSRLLPPSAFELRLMSRAPAPSPLRLILMTGAGAACEEAEADEDPTGEAVDPEGLPEEGALDAAMEDDTYTTLPPAPAARGWGRPLPRLSPDSTKWPRGDKIKPPPSGFGSPGAPLQRAKQYQEAMIYALNPHRNDQLPLEEIYLCCTVPGCSDIIQVSTSQQRHFKKLEADPWELTPPRRCELHKSLFRAGGKHGYGEGSSGRKTRLRLAQFAAGGAPGRDDDEDESSRGLQFLSKAYAAKGAHVLHHRPRLPDAPLIADHDSEDPSRHWIAPTKSSFILAVGPPPPAWQDLRAPQPVYKLQVELRNYVMLGDPAAWHAYVPDKAEPVGPACAVGTRYALNPPPVSATSTAPVVRAAEEATQLLNREREALLEARGQSQKYEKMAREIWDTKEALEKSVMELTTQLAQAKEQAEAANAAAEGLRATNASLVADNIALRSRLSTPAFPAPSTVTPTPPTPAPASALSARADSFDSFARNWHSYVLPLCAPPHHTGRSSPPAAATVHATPCSVMGQPVPPVPFTTVPHLLSPSVLNAPAAPFPPPAGWGAGGPLLGGRRHLSNPCAALSTPLYSLVNGSELGGGAPEPPVVTQSTLAGANLVPPSTASLSSRGHPPPATTTTPAHCTVTRQLSSTSPGPLVPRTLGVTVLDAPARDPPTPTGGGASEPPPVGHHPSRPRTAPRIPLYSLVNGSEFGGGAPEPSPGPPSTPAGVNLVPPSVATPSSTGGQPPPAATTTALALCTVAGQQPPPAPPEPPTLVPPPPSASVPNTGAPHPPAGGGAGGPPSAGHSPSGSWANGPPGALSMSGPSAPTLSDLRAALEADIAQRRQGGLAAMANHLFGYPPGPRNVATNDHRTPTRQGMTGMVNALRGSAPFPSSSPLAAANRQACPASVSASLTSLRAIILAHPDYFAEDRLWDMLEFTRQVELHNDPGWRIPAAHVSAIPRARTEGQILQFHITDIPHEFFQCRTEPSRGAVFRLLQTHFSSLYPGLDLHSEELFQFTGSPHLGQPSAIKAWFSHTNIAEKLAYEQFALEFECGDPLNRRLHAAHAVFLPVNQVEVRLGGNVLEYVLLLHSLAPSLFTTRAVCSLLALPFRVLCPNAVWGVRLGSPSQPLLDPNQSFWLIVDGHETYDALYSLSQRAGGFPLWPAQYDSLFSQEPHPLRATLLECARARPNPLVESVETAYAVRHLYSPLVTQATLAHLSRIAASAMTSPTELRLYLLKSVCGVPHTWAMRLKRILLPDGLKLTAIVYLFETAEARVDFLTWMMQQTSLYRIGDTSAMDPFFTCVPYVLPPQLPVTLNALDSLEVLDAASGQEWVPAYLPSSAERDALLTVSRRVANHSTHQFCPNYNGGGALALPLDESICNFARGLRPHQPKFFKLLTEIEAFIRQCPQAAALLQPVEMIINGSTQPVAWTEPLQRDPDRQLALWAREYNYSRDEFYSVISYGLREGHFLQVPSGNQLVLSLCRPIAWPSSGKGAGPSAALSPSPAFGRGRGSSGRTPKAPPRSAPASSRPAPKPPRRGAAPPPGAPPAAQAGLLPKP